jgi:hypothetical protein
VEVAVCVDFGFAGGVGFGEEGFVVEDLLGVSFCVEDYGADGSGTLCLILEEGTLLDVDGRRLVL